MVKPIAMTMMMVVVMIIIVTIEGEHVNRRKEEGKRRKCYSRFLMKEMEFFNVKQE